MFTVAQIEAAHEQVKSGADFPKYIQDIKQLGVKAFETWVFDSHTEYFGTDGFKTASNGKYQDLKIADTLNTDAFKNYLKMHQQGKTDYVTFCQHCAETGVEKWKVDLSQLTCTYFDKADNKILVEQIPV
ncbi:MAG: DUF1398 domain-containing protein [Aestuariibaculum sp.]